MSAASPPVGFADIARMAPWPLAGAMAAAAVSATLCLVPLWCLSVIAAHLLDGPYGDAALRPLLASALAAVMLRWALMAFSHAAAHTGALRASHTLRLRLTRHLAQVPLTVVDRRPPGRLRRVIADDVAALESFVAHLLPDATAAVVLPVTAFVWLCLADWPLALAALAPLPFALLAQVALLRGSDERLRQWSGMQQRIAAQTAQFIRGIHVVRSFGLSARTFGTLRATVETAAAWVGAIARRSGWAWAAFGATLSAGLPAVAVAGAWRYRQGSLDAATYVLCLLVAPAVLLPLLRLTHIVGEQRQRRDALARINAVLAEPVLPEPSPETAGGALPTAPLDIAFRHVSHAFGTRQAVRDIDVVLPAGKLTAIVGASGAGKTTLVRLAAREFDPDAGRVLLGGRDVRDWPLDALLQRFAIVGQEVQLLHGTVLDNLLLARPGATISEVQAATRAAQAHDFIMALPQRYQTPVGERGARLSGGERQRLSLARALLKDAPVLILDEATSHADPCSEALIGRALAHACRGRTVLAVAHRLHTIVHADLILVLDAGRLVDRGRHAELLGRCAHYRTLWNHYTAAHAPAPAP